MFNEWYFGTTFLFNATFNLFFYNLFFDSSILMKNVLMNIPIFFFLQIFFLICLSVWARAAGPRLRVDQIFTITWKEFLIILAGYLIFFSVFILI